MSPIHQLINSLNLPPNQSSINLLSTIQHINFKQFTIYYIQINNQFLLIYTYNHFKTLNQPITTYLTYHQSLHHLLTTI